MGLTSTVCSSKSMLESSSVVAAVECIQGSHRKTGKKIYFDWFYIDFSMQRKQTWSDWMESLVTDSQLDVDPDFYWHYHSIMLPPPLFTMGMVSSGWVTLFLLWYNSTPHKTALFIHRLNWSTI